MTEAKNGDLQQDNPNAAVLEMIDLKKQNALSEQVPPDVQALELQEATPGKELKDQGWKTCFDAYICFVACSMYCYHLNLYACTAL